MSADLLNTSGTNAGLGNQSIWANGQRDTSNSFSMNGVNADNIFNGKSSSQVTSGRVAVNIGEIGNSTNNPSGEIRHQHFGLWSHRPSIAFAPDRDHPGNARQFGDVRRLARLQ